MAVFVDTAWVSTLAGATGSAVDDDLGVESDWSWGGVVHLDVESVSKGGGRSLSPA